MGLTKIDDRGLKTPIDLLDNEKIRLGTGNDLELYHDGNNGNSHIKESGSGSLVLNADDLYLQNAAGTENLAVFKEDGAVELYHNNSKKFETTSTGVTVTGNVFPSANDSHALGGSSARWQELNISDVIDVSDSGKLRMGDSDDLQIYHDGSHSYIYDTGTGKLRLVTNSFRLLETDNSTNMIAADENGAVELYYDGSKKLETTSSGVKISDSILEIADATCLIDLMETSTTNHRLRNGSGNFLIQRISDDKSTETTQFDIDGGTGAVSLYHEGTKKLSTTANGICFNSDTAAANALDDYEEGSWTPALYNGTGITVHSASYTKVGNLCNVSAYVTISSNSSSGMVKFNSLPFTAANVGYSIGSAYTQNTGGTHVFSQIDSNSTNIIIYKTNGGTVYQSELSGAYVLFSGTYRTT